MLPILIFSLFVSSNCLSPYWDKPKVGMGALVGSTEYIQLPYATTFFRVTKNEKGEEFEHFFVNCDGRKNQSRCGRWKDVKTKEYVESGPTEWRSRSNALVIQDFRKSDAGVYMTGNRRNFYSVYLRNSRTDAVGDTSIMYLPPSDTFLRVVKNSTSAQEGKKHLYRVCNGNNKDICGFWEDVSTKKKVASGLTTYNATKELMTITNVQKLDAGTYMTADKNHNFELAVL